MVGTKLAPVANQMDKLFLMLLEHPELARELPALPCSVLAALALDDDENLDTTPPSLPLLALAA